MKSASECGRSADSTTRSSSPADAATEKSRVAPSAASPASDRSNGALTACSSRPAQDLQGLTQQHGDLDAAVRGLLLGDRLEGGERRLGLPAAPAQADQRRDQLVAP